MRPARPGPHAVPPRHPHAHADPSAKPQAVRTRNRPSCELQKLFNQFGSDKSREHGYHRAYCPMFSPLRDTATSIVELGSKGGAGCAAFAAFFPRAELFGVDDGAFFRIHPVRPERPAPGRAEELVPGHHGRPIDLGPRADHVHLFIADVRAEIPPRSRRDGPRDPPAGVSAGGASDGVAHVWRAGASAQ